MDAIALHAAGITHVVASLGIALNEAQIETAAAQTPSRKVCCCHTRYVH